MSSFIDFLKLPSRIILGVAIASGIILFIPESINDMIFMANFKAKYGFILGLTFLISSSLLLSTILSGLYKYIISSFKDFRIFINRKKLIKDLENSDKQIIAEMLKKEGNTMRLPMNNGSTIKLKSYTIISPAGNTHLVRSNDMKIPYFVQPWVVDLVRKNPKILSPH